MPWNDDDSTYLRKCALALQGNGRWRLWLQIAGPNHRWWRGEAAGHRNAWSSHSAKMCQLCWKHSSRYRRECPICHWLIAPGCWPKRCWSDELNHCRSCHALIEVLKHYWFKVDFMNIIMGMKGRRTSLKSIAIWTVRLECMLISWHMSVQTKILFGLNFTATNSRKLNIWF